MSATIDDKKLNGAGLATLWGIIKQYIVDNPSIPKATASTLGCIMVGTTLGVNNSGVLNLASGVVTAGTYKSVTVDTYGRVTAGTNPNTLAGYGITDAKIVDGSIILGENSITPITSLSGYATQTWVQQQGYLTEETYKGTVTQVKVGTTAYDPTSGVVSLPAYPTTLPASDVYSWAKAASKPSYTASEVGAATSGHTHTTSLASDSGTSTITLASAGKYKLTAGGTSVIFTMPTIPTVSYPVTSVNSKTGAVTLTASDVGAATSGHTHTTSIATSSGTNQLTLAFGTKYVLTAGGTSYIFTMPSNPNTNTTYKFTIGSTTNGDATNGVDLGTLKSETAAASGTTLSLVTTGEKATWNAKSNLTIGTTATTAAAGNHTHTLSIATSSGTNALTLAANTKYVLTAGGSTFIFTTPTDTNTWRPLGTGASDACAGNDSRLSDSRPASDVYSWAKASSKPTYTASEVGAATSGHTHTTSIATSTGTSQITLAHGGKYAITAGGTSYIFTMPSDNNTTYSAGTGLSLSGTTFSLATSGVTAGTYKRVTVDVYGRVTSGDNTDANDNTWRNIYTGGTSRVGTGTDTKAINFVAGSNVSISYEAAGTGSGQSGNANYFNVKIAATDTTYSAATQSAAGLMSAADKKKLDGIASGANAYSLPTASADTLGGIKVGTTLSISSGVLNLATSGVTAGTYKRVTVDSYGRVTSGDNTDADTNTWRGIYVKGTSSIGTGIDTKALNFAAGSNVSISFAAAGTGSGQSGNANYGTITINATDTTYSAATQSAAGLMSAADKKKLDGIASGANAYSLPAASTSALGGIKVNYTNSGKNYKVQLDSSNNAYVNVPWENTTYTIPTKVSQLTNDSGYITSYTNTWRNVYLAGTEKVGTGTGTKGLNFVAGSNVSITYEAAGTSSGQSGNANYFNIKIAATDTTYSVATQSANGLMSAADKKKLDGVSIGSLMGSTSIGDTVQPIYWNGSAFKVISYTIAKSVPSDAKFTDTNTWRPLGTGASDACAGNDSRLSNSRPASDVYSWAKESTKPSYAFNEITAGAATIGDGENYLLLRSNASWRGGVYWHTTGNEAMVFANVNATSSFIFANTDPASRTQWNTLTPWMQIKKGCVYINQLIANGTDPSYNLYVNGSMYVTSINGVNVGSSPKFTDTTYTFTNKGATLAWSTTSTIATVGGVDIKVTMPANPNTNTTYTIATGDSDGQIKVTPSSGSAYNVSVKGLGSNAYTSTSYLPLAGGTMGGTIFVCTSLGISDASGNGLLCYKPTTWGGVSSNQWGVGTIDVQGVIRSSASNLVHYKGNTAYDILDTSNSSVSLSGSTLTVKINGISQSLTNTNTWRGITDSYSGTSTDTSLSQKGGNALYNALLNGYASSAGNADTVDGWHVRDTARGLVGGFLQKYSADITVPAGTQYVKILDDVAGYSKFEFFIDVDGIPFGCEININSFAWTGWYSIVAKNPTGYGSGLIPTVYVVKKSSNGGFSVYLKVVRPNASSSATLKVSSTHAIVTNSFTTTEPTATAALDLTDNNWSFISNLRFRCDTLVSNNEVFVKGRANSDTKLTLKGSQYTMEFLIDSGNVNRGIYNRTGNDWMLYFNGQNTIMNYGNVGIRMNPTYSLHVSGNVGATGFINTSDIRTKNIVKDNLSVRLTDIANAPLFDFKWKDTSIDTDLHIGSSAQYWKNVIPEAVSAAKDEIGTLSMQYDVIALSAVISVAKETLSLKEKVALLETRVESLEKKIREYELN